MRIVKAKDYEEMSKLAGSFIMSQVIINPESVLGFATGTTPIGIYDKISLWNKDGLVDFTNVKTVNLDEYCGLSGDHPQSYRYFMDKYLFGRINIKKENTFLPDGSAVDCDTECERYEKVIQNLGGVDLQLLGIGNNGHIGFNEPCEIFPKYTNCVKLTQSTIDANSRLFEKKEDVPLFAMTMGIGTIMKARKILLIATGESKTEILKKSLTGPIDPQVPASILQLHPDVTVIADAKAMDW